MRSVSTVVKASVVQGRSGSYNRFKFHFSPLKSLEAFVVTLLLMTGFSSLGLAAIIEGTPGTPSCIVDQADYAFSTVNCTANDLGLSSPLLTVIKACDFPGDFATMEIKTDITVTSKTRYDIGFWISIDGDPNGDGSASGACTVINLDPTELDVLGNSINLDGNSCGDVFNTGELVDIEQIDLGTFSLPCIDTDGDGFIDVPVIVAYKNATGSCGGPLDAFPRTKSKCQEDLSQRFDVPVPGRIIVTKDTIPDAVKQFDFSLSGPALDPLPLDGFDGNESFQLADGETYDTAVFTGGLAPGSYNLQETPDAAYTSSIACNSDVDGPVANPAAIDLQAAETVTCIVTNTLNGSVAIVKRTIGRPQESVGDQFATFDFTHPQGGDFALTPSAEDTLGNGSDNASFDGLTPGDYEFTEEPKTGWSLTDLSCAGGITNIVGNKVTITVVADETITCTFENTELGAIIVDKVTNPTLAAQAFSFTTNYGAGSFQLADATTPNNSGPLLPSSTEGNYSVTEGFTAGWEETSAICSGDISGSKNPAALDLLPGETINCTFLNTKQVVVTLQKEWIGGEAGDTSALLAGDTRGDSAGAISTAAGGNETDTTNTAVLTTVIGQTVTLGEILGVSNVGDYTPDFACSTTVNAPTYSAGDTTATLLIDATDTAITCTFTNDRQLPSIAIAKSASPTTYAAPSVAVTYTFAVENTGNVTLASVVVTDPLSGLGAITCDWGNSSDAATGVGVLSAGETVSCSADYSTTQADVDAGSVGNTATATGTPPNGPDVTNTGSATITADQTKTISLDKTTTSTGYATVGETISYSYLVTNTGNVTLTGPATVADDKVTVTCPAGDLAPGAFVTCDATFTVTQADLDAGSVTNIATAAINGVTSPQDEVTVTADQTNTLTLVKTANPTTYTVVGDVISYSYALTNNGNVTLFPAYAVTDDKETVTCPAEPASLAPAATVTCSASHTITQADLDAGSIVNKATATAQADPAGETITNKATATATAQAAAVERSPVTSNEDTATVTVVRVNLAKTVNGPAARLAGGTYVVVYTITATNGGGGPGVYDLIDAFTPGVGITLDSATAVYLAGTENDRSGALGALPNFVTGEGLADGLNERWTVTAVFSIDLALVTAEGNDCVPGEENGANTGFTNGVTGSQTDTDLTDNTACTEFIPPGIDLDKSSDVATFSEVGDVINYSYVVTNQGPDTLAPGLVTVADNREIVTCPAAVPLPVGGTVTCTASHTMTQADIERGFLINVATAKADDLTSNEDNVIVTFEPQLIPPPEPEPLPPPVIPLDIISVPTLDLNGLLALIMLMLATGWYFRPAVTRRF